MVAAFSPAPAAPLPPMLAPLIGGGPLSAVYAGLSARLLQAFPPATFARGIVPARLTKTEWETLTRRVPAVMLGWAGMKPANSGSRVWRGLAEFTILLIAQNDRQEDLLPGNALRPGLFGMVQVAAVALHGLDVPGVGAISVAEGMPVYAEDWAKSDIAVAALSATVQFDLVDALSLSQLDDFLTNGVQWINEPDVGVELSNQGTA